MTEDTQQLPKVRRLSLGQAIDIEPPRREPLVMNYNAGRRSRSSKTHRRGSSAGRRRSASRGRKRLGPGQHWRDIAPMRMSERRNMPDHCFLVPEFRMYPICPRGRKTETEQGVRAAIRRARIETAIYPNDPVHRRALSRGLQLAKKHGMTEGRAASRRSSTASRRK